MAILRCWTTANSRSSMRRVSLSAISASTICTCFIHSRPARIARLGPITEPLSPRGARAANSIADAGWIVARRNSDMRSRQCYQAFRTTALAALRLLAVLIVLSASARLASAVVRNSYGTRAVKFDVDLIIAGAGPVGLRVARLLAQRSATRALSVALVDQHATTPVGDPRTLTLSYGSRMLLEPLGWPDAATPIQCIHISQRGHFGRMLIDCRAHDLPALGYAVPYGALMRALTGNIGTIGSVRHLKRATARAIAGATISKARCSVWCALKCRGPVGRGNVLRAKGRLRFCRLAACARRIMHWSGAARPMTHNGVWLAAMVRCLRNSARASASGWDALLQSSAAPFMRCVCSALSRVCRGV